MPLTKNAAIATTNITATIISVFIPFFIALFANDLQIYKQRKS